MCLWCNRRMDRHPPRGDGPCWCRSSARMGASHPPAKGLRGLVAPKRNLGTVSPRPRLLFATFPRTNRQSKGWTHTASKKRKHRNRQTQKMKKPRTGGAGLLGFHGGEPMMAWERHHATRFTPFTGSLCQAFCLTSQRSSLSVAMFHYYDGKDLSQVSTSLRTWSWAMP